MFSAFADEYLASPIHAQKKRSTRASERVVLEYWKAHLGSVRLDKITDVMVESFPRYSHVRADFYGARVSKLSRSDSKAF